MQREINRNHTGDWDQQRQRLSASLDGELNEDERVALERHLPACEQCQRALDELREVRALLRAMPIPTPPRSFVIPTEGAIPMPLATAATSHRAERAGRRQRARSGSLWSGMAQALGGFVAAAGVILVLGSSLIGTGSRFGAASTASSGAARPVQQEQHDNTSTSYNSRATPTNNSKAATPTKAVQDTPIPTQPAGTNERHMTGAPVYPENLPVVPIGGGMIAGGAALFVVGRVSGRRHRRV